MLLLLEGVDGSGKSTLAQQLQEALPGVSYTHHGPYKGYSGGELASAVMSSMRPAFVGVDTVVDRCWLSEPIYAEVFRKQPSRLSTAHVRMLERAALTRSAVIVLCQPPFEVCARAFTSGREEMMSEVKDLRRVYDRYALGPKSEVPIVKYDYTTDSMDDLLKRIKFTIEIAYPEPKVILIGDRPNLRTQDQLPYHVPFVTFSGRGCSDWLAEKLEEGGIKEADLDWYNAYDDKDTPLDVSALPADLPVVALGRHAEEWCKEAGVSHARCPHPQVHKKFHSEKPYQLIDILKEICNAKN